MSENNNVYLYYRTYAGWSGKNIFAKNKFELISVCWRSLEIKNIPFTSFVWIDNSTPEFTEFISSKFSSIHHTSEGFDVDDNLNRIPVFGGRGSYFKMREFMHNNNHADDDVILILEDDYLFVKGGFHEWIEACKHFKGFVSPCDHPDRYRRKDDAFAKKTKITVHNNRHWRQIESTTGVVGGRYKYFRRTFPIAKTPRVRINFFWPGRFLGKELVSMDRGFYRRIHYLLRIKLFGPIPGIAAHLSKGQIDSVVNWEKRYKELEEKV